MTSRDQARPGERQRAGRESAPTAPPPGPELGELLLAARERKGVDLYRAERDTKIRAKYLNALERGDFRELPGSVYTKGFLRNYALYLGLDPEAVLDQYRREYDANHPPERVVVVPRALETPSSGLTFTPGIVVAALLTVAVVAFGAYIAYQLLRFAQPPALAVTQPAIVSTLNADHVTMAGTSQANATITITGTGQQTYRISADGSGHWQQDVSLGKGRNEFTVVATDPTTGKNSAPINLIVTVPIPQIEAPTLAVTSPNDGASFTNGAIPVQGTTNATQVSVTAQYLGPAQPLPSAATASPVAAPPAKAIQVAPDGSFSDSYQLAPGRWTLTIAATSDQARTTTESRTVTVAFTGVNLAVSVKGAPAWIKVWVDGQLAPTIGSGQTLQPGQTVQFTGAHSVEVWTGNSGATYFTLNGTSLGALGPPGVPQTWLFAPPQAPVQTSHP